VGLRRLWRLLRAGLLVYLATLAVVLLVQFGWPLARDRALPNPADAIICLGAGMEDDPSPLPDAVTRARALTCAELLRADVAPVAVFTGAGNETSSAAAAMAAVAREEGVAEARIIVEPRAHSTIQNAAFATALLPPDARRLIVVSDAFHLPRAWVIFRVLGHDGVTVHATEARLEAPLATRLGWSLREAVVIWVNVGRLTVYGVAGALGVDRDTRIGWFN
jgi:uncharacterized SAM-binding protein YcdF (DUF218 family)